MTVQELNAKREAIFQRELEKFKAESRLMSDRHMSEAQARINLLQSEQEARSREEAIKQDLMRQRLDEYEQIGKARKAELQRQEDLLTQKHLRHNSFFLSLLSLLKKALSSRVLGLQI